MFVVWFGKFCSLLHPAHFATSFLELWLPMTWPAIFAWPFQGDAADCFYVLDEGAAVCTVRVHRDSEQLEVAAYGRGSYFGELGGVIQRVVQDGTREKQRLVQRMQRNFVKLLSS